MVLKTTPAPEEFDEILHARRLLKICDIAAGLSAEDRVWFLAHVCVDDERLRDDVNRLLEAVAGVGDFLERGPVVTRSRR